MLAVDKPRLPMIVMLMIARRRGIQGPPAVQVVGGVAFVLGSAFMALAIVHDLIPAVLNVAGMLGLLVAGSLLIWNWSRRPGWSELHEFAVAAGLLERLRAGGLDPAGLPVWNRAFVGDQQRLGLVVDGARPPGQRHVSLPRGQP